MPQASAERLSEYRRKRDFHKTPEPSGDPQPETEGHLYVMHKHAASHDHFDLRLEQDGVLRSWALPRGPSLEPGERRLAVEVEDHPLEYGGFEGVIPKGEYGGGTVMLWDAGRWKVNGKADENHVDFILEGRKLKGAWTLVRTRGSDRKKKRGGRNNNWLLIKRSDHPRQRLAPDDFSVATGRSIEEIAADHDAVWTRAGEVHAGTGFDIAKLPGVRKARAVAIPKPQLATLADAIPAGDDWLHEIKFDGYRVLAVIDDGKVRLVTRNGHDWTARFPEIAAALGRLDVKHAVLDGEAVALAADGTTSFRALQEALSAERSSHLVYQLFDALQVEQWDISGSPLLDRKRVLRQLLAAHPDDARIRYSDHIVGHGEQMYRHACELGLEGIISKRCDGAYRSGRNRQWLKVKCTKTREFVVGGFTRGERAGFGALLLGGYEDGDFVYAGRVGSGFSERQIRSLRERLDALRRDDSPFAGPVEDARQATWVSPELVVEVEFTERTRDGRLRHPVFRGVREDRNAGEIGLGGDEPMPNVAGTTASATPRRRLRRDEASVAGVRITHPERVMYPETGLTKLELARFYEDIADWIMPGIAGRPLSLLRCPEGRSGECFFQKHLGRTLGRQVPRVGFRESSGVKQYCYAESIEHLVALVQAGVLEFHPFGSRVDDLEHPDIMVFDLDPSPGVSWEQLLRTTRELRERIESEYGLACFLRTTGGKGLHIVVPLEPRADWDEVKAFAQAVSRQHAADDPKRHTTSLSKAKRKGRLFIDYLRNTRGATAIASYSTRARENATVAVPLPWDELTSSLRSDHYNVGNLRRRLIALKQDPWADFTAAAKPLTPGLLAAAGVKGG